MRMGEDGWRWVRMGEDGRRMRGMGGDLSENFSHYINNRKSTNLQKVHPPELVCPDSDFS